MSSPGEGEGEGVREMERQRGVSGGEREGEQTAPWTGGQGKRMLSWLATTAGSEPEDTSRGDSGDLGPGLQLLATADSCTSGFPLLRQGPQGHPVSQWGVAGGGAARPGMRASSGSLYF